MHYSETMCVLTQLLQTCCSAPTPVLQSELSINELSYKSDQVVVAAYPVKLSKQQRLPFLANLSFLGCTLSFIHVLMFNEELLFHWSTMFSNSLYLA